MTTTKDFASYQPGITWANVDIYDLEDKLQFQKPQLDAVPFLKSRDALIFGSGSLQQPALTSCPLCDRIVMNSHLSKHNELCPRNADSKLNQKESSVHLTGSVMSSNVPQPELDYDVQCGVRRCAESIMCSAHTFQEKQKVHRSQNLTVLLAKYALKVAGNDRSGSQLFQACHSEVIPVWRIGNRVIGVQESSELDALVDTILQRSRLYRQSRNGQQRRLFGAARILNYKQRMCQAFKQILMGNVPVGGSSGGQIKLSQTASNPHFQSLPEVYSSLHTGSNLNLTQSQGPFQNKETKKRKKSQQVPQL